MSDEKKDSPGTTADGVFTDAEAKSVAAIAVALMMSRSSVGPEQLHKHFIGLLEAFKAAREAERGAADTATMLGRTLGAAQRLRRFMDAYFTEDNITDEAGNVLGETAWIEGSR